MSKPTQDHARIAVLEVENVKRIQAFRAEIDDDQSLVIIGGDNGQGKTTALDSIKYAVGGKAAIPEDAVRHGAEKADILVKLDNGLVIKRVIKPDGKTSLTVQSKDGAKLSGPQVLLNGLYGALTFDPLAFERMPPAKQLEVIRQLTGLNFSEHDHKRKALFDKRTDVNRRLDEHKKIAANLPPHDASAPKAEISVSEVHDELLDVRNEQSAATQMQDDIVQYESTMTEIHGQIQRLQEKLDALTEKRDSTQRTLEEALSELERKRKPSEIEAELAQVEAINEKVRANQRRAEEQLAIDDLESQATCMTANLKKMDAEKKAAIAAAKLPVDGLSFDENGVYYNGIAFNECSGAEKLRISVAMGAAANPKLRVLLVPDGSLLDDKSMALLAELAAEHDLQVWLERVGDRDKSAIIIEDGMVREALATTEA